MKNKLSLPLRDAMMETGAGPRTHAVEQKLQGRDNMGMFIKKEPRLKNVEKHGPITGSHTTGPITDAMFTPHLTGKFNLIETS